MSASIQLRDLTVSYRRHPALHHVTGCFEAGSLTAVIGANGAGKSTLLKAIQGLLPVSEGSVVITPTSQRLAYLPQQSDVDRAFPIPVMDCVLMGDWSHSGIFGKIDSAACTRAANAIEAVGLSGFERRALGTLSAGQFQRVLFARMLMQDASLILLDEPFNAVDERTTSDLMVIVEGWHREGRTIIAVLHDEGLVRRHFPQTLLLARRVIGWGPTAEVLQPQNLGAARAMCEAWDESAAPCEMPDAA